jgi:hypothetical protein
MSANRIEASSYLSAMMLCAGFFRRSAMDAGRMLANSDSERWYSVSMALSARAISRSAYQTVVTTRTHAAMVLTMKPILNAQSGCVPVLCGTHISRPITVTAPSTARQEASTMCSIPSTSTTIAPATAK